MAHGPIIATTEGAAGKPLLIVHGGAGRRSTPMTAEWAAGEDEAIRRALDAGMACLDAGDDAIDAAIAAIHVLEDSPFFNAAHGAALTSEGKAELDACVVTGDGCSGAVTGVTTVRNPIDAARAVLERSKHVLFADPAPGQLLDWGVELVPNDYFVVPARVRQLEAAKAGSGEPWGDLDPNERHGTIGCVARDSKGRIVAGTSTGGICNQLPGRVGDTPLEGAGTYANQATCAVSCTGTGEKFIEECAAYQVHARILWGGQSPERAAAETLMAVEDRGGDGGVIVLTPEGEGLAAYNEGAQMTYGFAWGDHRVTHE